MGLPAFGETKSEQIHIFLIAPIYCLGNFHSERIFSTIIDYKGYSGKKSTFL